MAQDTDLDYQRNLVRLKVQHASEVYGFASTYDNAIVVAGYAAFFGLWAGVSKDVTTTCRTATAALMGASLTLYVVWHIAQMLNRQRFELRQADAFELQDDPDAFLAEWEAIKKQREASWVTLIRYWRPIFTLCVAFGMAGAATLVWNAIAVATGLPLQLTG